MKLRFKTGDITTYNNTLIYKSCNTTNLFYLDNLFENSNYYEFDILDNKEEELVTDFFRDDDENTTL